MNPIPQMTRRIASAGILAIELMTPAPGRGQDPLVTGARISVIRDPASVVSVTLENLRHAPLVAWELGLQRSGADRPETIESADFSAAGPWAPDFGPVAPNERRTATFHSPADPSSVPMVTLAVFADGYVEGTATSVAGFRKRREQEREDLRFWIDALETMPAGSDEGLRRYVRNQLTLGAAQGPESIFAANLRGVVTEKAQRPPGWLAGAVRQQVRAARERLASLERPLTGLASAAGEVTGVRLSRVPGEGHTTIGAEIENLSEVPLEALRVVYPGGDRTIDFCGVLGPADGPIQPGERRTLRLEPAVDANTPTPVVTLTFLLFSDFTFQGRTADRDDVLRGRERLADQLAFAVAALSEAAHLLPEQIAPFLESQRRSRAIATAADPQGPDRSWELGEAIRQITAGQGDARALSSAMAARLETQREQLLRHRSTPGGQAR